MALHAYSVQQTISIWMAIAWAGLGVLFALRTIAAIHAGVRNGWKGARASHQNDNGVPESGPRRRSLSIGAGIAFGLLLMNAALLIWQGSLQINANLLDLTHSTDTENTPESAVDTVTAVQRSAQDAATPQKQGENLITTPTLAITSEAQIQQTMVTLTPTELAATPSPPIESNTEGESTNSPPDVILLVPPTPSPMPILIPTPTPAPIGEPFLTVHSSEGANIRSMPDLTADVVTIVVDGTIIPVVGRTKDNQWYLIRISSDVSGWISALVVEVTGESEIIPVVEVD
jgi:hypothetical protein